MSKLKGTHDRMIDRRYGHAGKVVRLVPGGTDIEVSVKLLRRFAREQDNLPNEAVQSDTWFIVPSKPLRDAGFPLPVVRGDRIIETVEGEDHIFTAFEVLLRWEGDYLAGFTVRCTG